MGAGQELEDRPNVVGLRLDPRRAERLGFARHPGHELVEDVLRDRDQHRAGTPGDGMANGLTDERLGPGGAVDLDRPLRQPTDRSDDVRLLERLATPDRPVNATDDREHRARVGAGGVDPDRQVGRTDGSGARGRRPVVR